MRRSRASRKYLLF